MKYIYPIQRLLIVLMLTASLVRANNTISASPLTVTFVGTGGPELSLDREGIATLVSNSEHNLLFDTGRNVLQNLYEAGVDPLTVQKIFFTHLHNDHIEGLANLWMTGWFLLGRTEPLEVWGPVGTQAMINGMYSMYQFDIQHRSGQYNNAANLIIKVHEIETDGVVLKSNNLSVAAFSIEHGDGNPAFAYRIQTDKHAVLLTGDTRLTQKLIDYGQGVDLLASNILALSDQLASKPELIEVQQKLMTIAEAAALFKSTAPSMAAYTHFVTKEIPGDIDEFITEQTRKNGYAGNLFLAKDGWRIDIPSMVVSPPPKPTELPNLDRKKSYSDH